MCDVTHHATGNIARPGTHSLRTLLSECMYLNTYMYIFAIALNLSCEYMYMYSNICPPFMMPETILISFRYVQMADQQDENYMCIVRCSYPLLHNPIERTYPSFYESSLTS